jgi:hypothetical protein
MNFLTLRGGDHLFPVKLSHCDLARAIATSPPAGNDLWLFIGADLVLFGLGKPQTSVESQR